MENKKYIVKNYLNTADIEEDLNKLDAEGYEVWKHEVIQRSQDDTVIYVVYIKRLDINVKFD